MSYSWFAADVIQLCKLGICHVGAHLKCEISCKYSALFQIRCSMGTLSEKNSELQENILLRIPMLLNYAEGLESYFQEQYTRLFIFFLKNDKGFEVYC